MQITTYTTIKSKFKNQAPMKPSTTNPSQLCVGESSHLFITYPNYLNHTFLIFSTTKVTRILS